MPTLGSWPWRLEVSPAIGCGLVVADHAKQSGPLSHGKGVQGQTEVLPLSQLVREAEQLVLGLPHPSTRRILGVNHSG